MKNIICGFAGIGKSTLMKMSDWVDLESTPFAKNWDIYSDVAIHMAKNGHRVMLSCHKELRDILLEKGADFEVIIPRIEDKEEYLSRYAERGNTEQFIKLFDDKWEDFINEILADKDKMNVVVLGENEYLSDYFEHEYCSSFEDI